MLRDLLRGTTAPPASEKTYARGRLGACFVPPPQVKLARPMQSGSAQGLTNECPLRSSFVILLVQSVAMG